MHELLRRLSLRRLGLLFGHVPGHGARLGLDQNGLRACLCTHRGEFMHTISCMTSHYPSQPLNACFPPFIQVYVVIRRGRTWRRGGDERGWGSFGTGRTQLAQTPRLTYLRAHTVKNSLPTYLLRATALVQHAIEVVLVACVLLAGPGVP